MTSSFSSGCFALPPLRIQREPSALKKIGGVRSNAGVAGLPSNISRNDWSVSVVWL
jgi:hypothetical protein